MVASPDPTTHREPTLTASHRACGYESQKPEATIGCNELNPMVKLGKPESHAIVEE